MIFRFWLPFDTARRTLTFWPAESPIVLAASSDRGAEAGSARTITHARTHSLAFQQIFWLNTTGSLLKEKQRVTRV